MFTESKLAQFITVLGFLLLLGCKAPDAPGLFWLNYQREFLGEHTVCKMEYGGNTDGYMKFLWGAGVTMRFSQPEVISYAEGNGWRLIDKQDFSPTHQSTEIPHRQRRSSNEPVFLPVESTIMRFNSGWTREPRLSSDKFSSDAFLQISKDGTQLCVICFWGSE